MSLFAVVGHATVCDIISIPTSTLSRDFVSTDATQWVCVSPAKWFSELCIDANIFPQLASQVCHRSEDTSGNDIALDLRKPQLHLIQPRRIGRGKVETDFLVVLQKLLHRFGLVRRQIVEHDGNLLRPACFLD